jgi:hypothetical protein
MDGVLADMHALIIGSIAMILPVLTVKNHQAMVAYHKRCAERHEAAIGRWWDFVPPESPPEAPPRVPFD